MANQTGMFTAVAPNGYDLVGVCIYHDGEHGTIIGYVPDSYAEPMYRVEFSRGRVATLKLNEMGAK
jgi:hypothetical protein